jgi:predicted nucleic acid-binding protein
MITAVDTCVLLDVFLADASFGPGSAEALKTSLAEGRMVACDAVWAEVLSAFPSRQAAIEALLRLGVGFDPLGSEAAGLAGATFRQYRQGGGPRTRVAADFLIGAHARVQTDRLLTRDHGFFREWFTGLRVVDPAT